MSAAKKRTTPTKKAPAKRGPKVRSPKSGRQRAKLPAAIIAELGPPPDGALEGSHWASRLLKKVGWLSLTGQISAATASEVRALVGAIHRSMPSDTAAELDRLIRSDVEATEADDVGPTMTKRVPR